MNQGRLIMYVDKLNFILGIRKTIVTLALSIFAFSCTNYGEGGNTKVELDRLAAVVIADPVGESSAPLTPEDLKNFRENDQRNSKAAAIHGLRSLQIDGLAGTGEGLLVGIWDGGGVLETHQEFDPSRVLIGSDINATHPHATHVAGTLAARGVEGFEEAQGMVPDADILSMNYCGDVSAEVKAAYEANENLAVTNHSYAQPLSFGQYLGSANRLDALVNELPQAVMVVAAGNSGWADIDASDRSKEERGYGTINAPGTAKNIISVGSMSDLPFGLEVDFISILGDIPLEPYSGTGPTADGRIKPDVVANGERLYSPYSQHSGERAWWDCNGGEPFPEPETCTSVSAEAGNLRQCYKKDSGTSMATPTVSGIVTVLQEIALGETSLGRLLTAVEVRALLIHTAESSDNQSRPTYKFGWGAVNARKAVEHLRHWRGGIDQKGNHHIIRLENISESTTWQLKRVPGERNRPAPARATLVWDDDAGEGLVINLDMSLKAIETDETILPWSLNPDQPDWQAVRTENRVDNVERIDLSDAEYRTELFELTVTLASENSTSATLLISGFELTEYQQ